MQIDRVVGDFNYRITSNGNTYRCTKLLLNDPKAKPEEVAYLNELPAEVWKAFCEYCRVAGSTPAQSPTAY
jgi:hypothetical protein